jgi:GNAT superfamily N-acetyltransferase
MNTNTLTLDASAIDGLAFRHFKDRSDYAEFVRISNAAWHFDSMEDMMTLAQMENMYNHLTNCDPQRDFLIAEVAGGEMIGFGRMWRAEQTDGTRRFSYFFRLHPTWRRKRIGTFALNWFEQHAHELNAELPRNNNTVLDTWARDKETSVHAILKRANYTPIRYGFEMARSLHDPIPDFKLPDDLEVRTVTAEDARRLWAADVEAFRDHWGFAEPTEAEFQRWINDPVQFQPELFKVAFDKSNGEVAGMVNGYINHEENEELKRKRGYTENISTRRAYRKRGVARALIVENLKMFRDMGYDEAALGVDASNPTGALRVYESCGFKPIKIETVYQKKLIG